jgi:Flp pilus assembly protein TadG
MKPLQHIRRKLRAFGLGQKGSATVEFALVFPAFMVLFISSFELGLMTIRHTMLERGLDQTVRLVRLSTNAPPNYQALKTSICDYSSLIPECDKNLKLEMVRIDPQAGAVSLSKNVDCVDRADELAPVREYVTGDENDLMVLRACVLFDPIFPTTGLGFHLPKESGDAYALVSISMYVSEPK